MPNALNTNPKHVPVLDPRFILPALVLQSVWRWTGFMFVSMSAIAYVAALLVYQLGLAFGFG